MTENPAIASIRNTIRNLKGRTQPGGFLNTELNAARAELERVEGQIANTEEMILAWEQILEQLGRDQKTLDKAQEEFRKRHGMNGKGLYAGEIAVSIDGVTLQTIPPSVTGIGAHAGSISIDTNPDPRTYLVN